MLASYRGCQGETSRGVSKAAEAARRQRAGLSAVRSAKHDVSVEVLNAAKLASSRQQAVQHTQAVSKSRALVIVRIRQRHWTGNKAEQNSWPSSRTLT